MPVVSQAVEDYLKAIYELSGGDPQARVGTTRLADKLGFSGASVTGMLQKLASSEPKLVDYKRYYGVRLTPVGRKLALEVVRHHRLVEAYLTEALGYSWDEVHEEADQLEHVISESFERRIAEFLGHPQVDPHGDPIPDQEGNVQPTSGTSLVDLAIGERATITRVADDPGLLRILDDLELSIGSEIVLEGVEEKAVHLSHGDASGELEMPVSRAKQVFVTSGS